MADNDNVSEKSDSTIVAAATPPPSKSKKKTTKPKKTTQYLFEDPEFDRCLRFYRAFPFIKTKLTPDSVVFSLPGNRFEDRTQAYNLIEEEIGPTIGKFFLPLSVQYPQTNGDLIINTKFCDDADTEKAVYTGLNLDGVYYKALYYSGIRPLNSYIRVKLTQVPIKTDDSLLYGLQRILNQYGKIVQIGKCYINGYCEGGVAVTLYRGEVYRNPLPSQTLDLSLWGVHVPVAYSDVVTRFCTRCFETKHAIQNCPN